MPARLLALALALPAAAQEVDFATEIQPIFAARCYECHGEKEQEGDLRLDRRSGVFHADESTWVIRPGKPKESLLVERISLPKDHVDIMPAEGEPLTADEIAKIARWIEQGANWPADEAAAPATAPAKPPVEVIEIALEEAERERAAAAMQALTKRGAAAAPIARDHAGIDVNLSLVRPPANDADLAAVRELGPALVWLNLTRSEVTDAGLAALQPCRNLRRLHLAQTAVGDAGLAHLRGLAELRFLNLFGTKVTDAGLAHLHGLARLEKLFLWQTAVTDAGVAALQAALPKLAIDRGGYAEQVLEVARELAAAEARAKAALGDGAINAKCPVSGEAVNPKITFVFEERPVAFCCEKCKAKFEAEPGKFTPNLPPKEKEKAKEKGNG